MRSGFRADPTPTPDANTTGGSGGVPPINRPRPIFLRQVIEAIVKLNIDAIQS